MNAPQKALVADPEAAIQYYLNEGWNGKGRSPYDLLIIGECIFATQRTKRHHVHSDAADDAREYRDIVLSRARKRWLDGYYADPFTQNPRRRPENYNKRRR